MAIVDGWRERHGTCRFGTYRPADSEGLLEAACAHPQSGPRYTERYCACDCPAYLARAGRLPHGRIPVPAPAAESLAVSKE